MLIATVTDAEGLSVRILVLNSQLQQSAICFQNHREISQSM